MPLQVIQRPQAIFGYYTFHVTSAATTNAIVIKQGSGQLFGWFITNTSAALSYVVFHDQATVPVAGNNVWWKMGIPTTGAANLLTSPVGIQFTKGLAITTVTGAADTNATAVAASDLIINLFYI